MVLLFPKSWSIVTTIIHTYIMFASTGFSATTSDITLITAWYPNPGYNPKYPNQTEYRDRVRVIFSRISTPFIVYAPPEEAEFLRSVRPVGFPMVLNHTYNTIWDVPNLAPYTHSFHTTQRLLAFEDDDPSALEDTPHMYGVWNAKVHFLEQAAQINTFNSTFFFWLDSATTLISSTLDSLWPNPQTVREVLSASKGWQDHVLVNVREQKPCLTQDHFLRYIAPLERTIAGVFFGGSKNAIEWLADRYYQILAYYYSLGQFIGVDEQLLLSIGMLYPDNFVSIPAYSYLDPSLETNYHVWCFWEFLESEPEDYICGDLPQPTLFRDVSFHSPCHNPCNVVLLDRSTVCLKVP